jgi:pyruvate,orthophosphate dikinase
VEQLDEFHELDARMKQIVTAWQMRDEQTFNDHSDTEYDARVMSNLEALHADTDAWLVPLGERFSRFGAYSKRLSAALAAAQSGDQRFVASPRVDSYHSVWFELHEDLIRLAGRKRSEVSG